MGCPPANVLTRCYSFLKALAEKYEARRLRRDALAILGSDAATYDTEHLRSVSSEISTHLELVRNASYAGEQQPMVMERLKAIHREVRLRHDQAGLSAVTLTIIYFRSQQLGEAGRPAYEEIEAFLNEWNGSQ